MFALVSMPWTNYVQPSLGLAILKAELEREGIASRVYQANLDLLKYISFQTYDMVADRMALNEFLFTAVLDPEIDARQSESFADHCRYLRQRKISERYATGEQLAELFLTLRNHVIPTYLAECADRILAMKPTIVGFTCMFDQTMAAAAVAKLLKQADPNLLIVLGGYAVQHENGVEVLKAFPWIDAIARGDGEPVAAALARASVGEGSIDRIDGLLTRADLGEKTERPPRRWDMARSLPPNYDDWFEDLKRIEHEHAIVLKSPYLYMESSRGCWWGQKHHCTFCGIDEDSLQYRSKSPAQVIAEIRALRSRYGDAISLRFADYILPHRFCRDLLPNLAEFDPPLELEGEIKANQTRDTIRTFARAGFAGLQPGIESFSTATLRKMDKGVSGMQNVQLLKWGYVESIEIQYNILMGFPDDALQDYQFLVERLPRLYHLTPPNDCAGVAITRFAPLQTNPQRFGYNGPMRHHPYYEVLFSNCFIKSSGFDLDNYCYHFEKYYRCDAGLEEAYGQITIQARHWKDQHRARDVYLGYTRTSAGYGFEDTRFGETERFSIEGLLAQVYSRCDDVAVSIGAMASELVPDNRDGDRLVRDAVDELERLRLVWVEDDKVFGLGTPVETARKHAERGWKWRWNSLAR
jgi:ribosomal peptide maturation radical SAM protein 1